MKLRFPTALLAGCVLSFVALPGLTRDAHAISIDNDVSLDWQNKAFGDFTPAVTNGNFVVNSPADLSAILVTVFIERADLLAGYDLTLDVVNPFTSVPGDYAPILVSGSPLKLTYAAGEDYDGDPLPDAADPTAENFFREPVPTTYSKNLALSDFQNSGVLAGLLAGGPLGFSVNGQFYGTQDLDADIPCQIDPDVCKSFSDDTDPPGSASVTVTGGQPFPPPTTVPEPGALSLLLIGIASGVGLRRRLR
jgi:hypothetical protein